MPNLCDSAENAPPSIAHLTRSNYLGGTHDGGSYTPTNSAITRLGHATQLAENTSYKSFSRDSGHGGSEQEDSPRTPWIYHHHHPQSLRTRTLGHPKLLGSPHSVVTPSSVAGNTMIGNSYSFSLLPYASTTMSPVMTTAGVVTSATDPRIINKVPWMNNHYSEIDPVYEEVINNRAEAIQVSDLSDEDNNKLSSGSSSVTTPLRSGLSPKNCSGGIVPGGIHYSPLGDGMSPLSQRCNAVIHSPVLVGEQYSLDCNTDGITDIGNINNSLLNRGGIDVRQNYYLSNDNLMTVAVLNGEQVVCRLSSPSSSKISSPNQENIPRYVGLLSDSSSNCRSDKVQNVSDMNAI